MEPIATIGSRRLWRPPSPSARLGNESVEPSAAIPASVYGGR